MIDFREKYKMDFNEKIRNNLRNDTLLALLIDRYIFPMNLLIIGDDNVNHLPDLWDIYKTNGFEFVQCELDCDLDKKKIYDALRQSGYDYNKTINLLKTDNFPIQEYCFHCYEGKIVAFYHNELGRNFDYLRSIYERNIKNKLEKLNNGNYNGCQKCSLVISNIERLRDKSDINLIKEIYEKLSLTFAKNFDNVYVITTTGIYQVSNNTEVIVEFEDFEFSYYVYLMKVILKFIDELNPLSENNTRIELLSEVKTAYHLLEQIIHKTGKFCNYQTFVNLESLKMLTINYIVALIGKRKNDKLSLYYTKIKDDLDKFCEEHKDEYEALELARDKVYSHFDMDYRGKCGIISFSFIEDCIEFIEKSLQKLTKLT